MEYDSFPRGLHRRSNSFIPPMGWIMFGALLAYSHFTVSNWLFDPNPHLSIFSVFYFSFFVSLGAVLWACINYLDNFLERTRFTTLRWRMAFGSIVIFLGSVAAFHLVYSLAFFLVMGRATRGDLTGTWIGPSMATLLIYIWLLLDRAASAQRARTVHLQLETDLLATALDNAELAMLEAQIEPHFLFNTLAHVKRQYRLDLHAADQMLTALIEYLDRAVPALQRADWRIDDELGLIQNYLQILQQRFGDRLHFSIAAAERDRVARLPALTIATLVENAVRHGLAPKTEGGEIAIAVESEGDSLLITVRDNGVGLRQSSGSGLGLATVRARLRSAFATRTILLVEPQASGGVCASIRIPLEQMADIAKRGEVDAS